MAEGWENAAGFNIRPPRTCAGNQMGTPGARLGRVISSNPRPRKFSAVNTSMGNPLRARSIALKFHLRKPAYRKPALKFCRTSKDAEARSADGESCRAAKYTPESKDPLS